ncbi:hypothetical protein DFP78_105261 [Photobacterium lutimaris]|nr:hypothetical protein DFP78_105261 [Photobacterium lutimaris]
MMTLNLVAYLLYEVENASNVKETNHTTAI